MAVAFSDDKVGHAEAPLPVRAPVVADLSRPRFLAPGDTAELTLELHNLAGEPGEYRLVVTADGAAAIRSSAERRVGKECVRSCRSQCAPFLSKQKIIKYEEK